MEKTTQKRSLAATVANLARMVRAHWNEPPAGRYMPYKEIVSYSAGGIGVKFLAVMAMNTILSASNTLIGNTIGIKPLHVYILYFISVLVNIPLSGIRANIIDNTRSKEGKYRPYIVKMGIPSAIVTILFVWFPYNRFGALFGEGTIFGEEKAYVVTCALVLLFNFFQNFFYYFFTEAYDNLIHVLSPNTQERADVSTIKGVVYSLAPSILNLAMPIFAGLLTNDNLYDIRLFRYIYPPVAIASVVLSIVVYANTKEKIVQARTHVIQIRFMDSLREVLRNKYFWVIAMATWLGFLETSMTNVLTWLYTYGGICGSSAYTIITLFCQNAGLVGMLLAPVFIRLWGKRVVLIGTNVMNIVFIGLMFPVVRIIDMSGADTSALTTWVPLLLLVVCYWMNNLMNAFMQILTPSINADIRDYQQYVSGERIDGMFSTITAVGGLVTVASSGIVNFLYDRFGINETTAAQVLNDPSVMNKVLRNGNLVSDVIADTDTSSIAYFSLYDGDILQTVCGVLIVASMVGAFINVLPYFFYDLTEIKQQGMVRVLKIRAFFEDFGNGNLTDDDLCEVVEMVDRAKSLSQETPVKVTKDALKAAKKTKNLAAVAAAKKERKEQLARNQEIRLAPFVLNELTRFESEAGARELADAKAIYAAGLAGLRDASLKELRADLREAKALPKRNDAQKELRNYRVHFCRTRLTARKYIDKYYPNGMAVETPDEAPLNALLVTEEAYDKEEEQLYKRLFEAGDRKDKAAQKELKAQLKALKNKFKALNKQIRAEQDKRVNYTRSAKPYLDASRVLTQAENYTHFGELEARYRALKEKEAAAQV